MKKIDINKEELYKVLYESESLNIARLLREYDIILKAIECEVVT